MSLVNYRVLQLQTSPARLAILLLISVRMPSSSIWPCAETGPAQSTLRKDAQAVVPVRYPNSLHPHSRLILLPLPLQITSTKIRVLSRMPTSTLPPWESTSEIIYYGITILVFWLLKFNYVLRFWGSSAPFPVGQFCNDCQKRERLGFTMRIQVLFFFVVRMVNQDCP